MTLPADPVLAKSARQNHIEGSLDPRGNITGPRIVATLALRTGHAEKLMHGLHGLAELFSSPLLIWKFGRPVQSVQSVTELLITGGGR